MGMLLIGKMILLTVAWSLGWKVLVSEGMILESLGKWAENKVENGHKFYDVFICEWCVSNLHGILIVWPLAFGLEIMPFEWNYKYVLMYPFCAMGSSFISGVIWTVYLKTSAEKEYLNSITDKE